MIRLALAALASCAGMPEAAPATDTLRVRMTSAAPLLDGRGSDAEYGGDALQLDAGSGPVRIWLAHRGDTLFVAADVPDSTMYWGDDVVISIDGDGSGGSAPGAGDRSWVIRRVLDSSVVLTATGDGRWEPAGGAPRLGADRDGPGWAVRTVAGATRWSMELRIALSPGGHGTRGSVPRIALRTFNDRPGPTWSTWPLPPTGVPAQRLDRVPDLWAPVLLLPDPPTPPRR